MILIQIEIKDGKDTYEVNTDCMNGKYKNLKAPIEDSARKIIEILQKVYREL